MVICCFGSALETAVNGWDLGKKEVQEPRTRRFEVSFLSAQKVTLGTGRCPLGTVFVTQ